MDLSIIQHLRAQAERYDRLARTLDPRGDGSFLRTMAAGYLAEAERQARVAAEAGTMLTAAPNRHFTLGTRRSTARRADLNVGQGE